MLIYLNPILPTPALPKPLSTRFGLHSLAIRHLDTPKKRPPTFM